MTLLTRTMLERCWNDARPMLDRCQVLMLGINGTRRECREWRETSGVGLCHRVAQKAQESANR